MKDQSVNEIVQEWKKSQQMEPLFNRNGNSSQFPLTYQDSMSFAPNFPFCAFGALRAEGNLDNKNGIAFVVEDNYLLTCASNVYSHEQGYYRNITFTINSNRKQGYDTHKISNVIIPQQYRILPQKDRSQYNYALLFIEGQPKMRDKYGSIGIQFKDHGYRKAMYFECTIDSKRSLQLIGVHQFQISSDKNRIKVSNRQNNANKQGQSMVVSGSPLFFQNYSGIYIAGGLVLSGEDSPYTSCVIFDNAMYSLMAQKVKVQNRCLNFSNLNFEEQDLSYLREQIKIDIGQLYLLECNLNEMQNTFFQQLPLSTVSSFCLYKIQINNDLSFLRLNTFKDIKILNLLDSQIGPQGCEIIASLYFHALRQLQLDWNPIGNQGCKHISKMKSPFIRVLSLGKCQFNNEGLRFLVQSKRNNLDFLNLDCNEFENNASTILQEANFPRINRLSLQHRKKGIKFKIFNVFLVENAHKFDPKYNQFYSYNNKIGRMGCKMIKQSDVALIILRIFNCHIDSVGVKWLCKANQSRLFWLSLSQNQIGDQGCLNLSKAHMPVLQQISLHENELRVQGLKKLLKTDRAQPNKTFKNSKLDEFVNKISNKISSEGHQ